MGNKLSNDENAEGMGALNAFSRKNDQNIMNVAVTQDGEEIFNQAVKVFISDCNIYSKVDILWEDAGLSRNAFSKLGLYGSYSTGYCKMEYDGELRIYSENEIVITTS